MEKLRLRSWELWKALGKSEIRRQEALLSLDLASLVGSEVPRIPLLIYWICELKLFSPLSCLEKRLLAPGSLDRASHISSRYQHCPLPLTLTSTFYSSIELFFYLSVSSPPSQLQILSLFSHSPPLPQRRLRLRLRLQRQHQRRLRRQHHQVIHLVL